MTGGAAVGEHGDEQKRKKKDLDLVLKVHGSETGSQ